MILVRVRKEIYMVLEMALEIGVMMEPFPGRDPSTHCIV